MTIISWNINGVRAIHKKGDLGRFFKDQNPDVLCLQEVKAKAEQIPANFLADLKKWGYFFYCNPSSLKLGHSGTAILTRTKPNKVGFEIGLKEFDQAGRVIRCDLDNFTLFNFYITNGGRAKKEMPFKLSAYDFLIDFFKKELLKNKKLILLGDFNVAHQEIDLARPKNNKNNTGFTAEEREKIDKLLELGFLDTFRVFNQEGGNYTWWSNFAKARERNIGWRIDYCFVSNTLKNNLKSAFILPKVMGSDHCPVGIDIDL